MGISRPTPHVCLPIFFYHHPVPVALLVCRFDPPRLDTAETIAEAGDLGVHVKMLTVMQWQLQRYVHCHIPSSGVRLS